MTTDIKKYKLNDFYLQSTLMALTVICAGLFQLIGAIPLFLFLFGIVQMRSFYIHNKFITDYNISRYRKIYRIMLIIHHVLIIPSAFAFFFPLIITGSILSIFYYGITFSEHQEFSKQQKAKFEEEFHIHKQLNF